MVDKLASLEVCKKSNIHLKEQVVSLKAHVLELEGIIENLESVVGELKEAQHERFIEGGFCRCWMVLGIVWLLLWSLMIMFILGRSIVWLI